MGTWPNVSSSQVPEMIVKHMGLCWSITASVGSFQLIGARQDGRRSVLVVMVGLVTLKIPWSWTPFNMQMGVLGLSVKGRGRELGLREDVYSGWSCGKLQRLLFLKSAHSPVVKAGSGRKKTGCTAEKFLAKNAAAWPSGSAGVRWREALRGGEGPGSAGVRGGLCA